MRWIKRGLTVVVGLIFVLIGALVVNHFVEQAQTRNFYATRPILSEMHQAAIQASNDRTRGSASRAQDILETRVPVGTPRSDAISMLAAEGVNCTRSRDGLVCGVKDAPPVIFNWHIELGFDGEDKLNWTRVLILK